MVVYICTEHILYIAVMQGIVQLKCFVLYIRTLPSWTAAVCATLTGGKCQLLEISLLCSIVGCYKYMGTVLCCPHCFPSDPPGPVSIFWPQASTVFLQETLGRTRVKQKPAFLWRAEKEGGERLIGKWGFGITSGLSTGLPGCLGGLGRAQLQVGGMTWVVQTVQKFLCMF